MIKNLNIFANADERNSFLYYQYSIRDKVNPTINFYHKYKEGCFEVLSEDILPKMEVLDFLEKLGFSIDNPGTYLYKDMVVKAMDYLNGTDNFGNSISRDELLQQMKKPFSQFYTDVARNNLDIGIKTFHAYVEQAIENISYANADAGLLFEVYSNFSQHSDYGEYAFAIALCIAEKEKSNKKGSVKQITMTPISIQVGN